MKTKLILLCTFLMLNCFLARGQESIDTLGLLQSYAQKADPGITALLNEQLSQHGQLKIEKYGRYSDPFSQAMEHTFIRFALENNAQVKLKLEYYQLNFKTTLEEEEYFLQLTFEKYYPDHLLDFLELKMLSETPITLDNIINYNTFLSMDGLAGNFNIIRQSSVQLTTRQDVGQTNSSIFINGISLHDLLHPNSGFSESFTSDNCECLFWHCWLSCMDIEYDFLENVIWTVCTTSCAASVLVYPAPVCLVCVYSLVGAGSICGGQCSLDPCQHGYKCTPGTIHPEDDPECTNSGQISHFVCDCDGQGYHPESQDCPPGSTCQGDGVCAPCEITSGSGGGEPGGGGTEPNPDDEDGGGFTSGSPDQSKGIDCNSLTLSETHYHETAPGTFDGSITVVASSGNGNYHYQWDDSTTGAVRQNLSAGTYCVTVTDKRCCYRILCVEIVAEACVGLNWEVELTPSPACNLDDGSILASTVTGGTLPYSYLWSTGTTGPNATGLEVGFYTVTISDNYNCTTEDGILLTGADGNPPDLSASVITPICPNDPNSGAINLVIQSSAPAISYIWSNGDFEQDISDLSEGTYTITVVDECSNEYSQDFEVLPLEPSLDVLHTLDNVCYGAITVSLENGNPPYTFSIEGPGANESVTSEEDYYTFENLCEGDFELTLSNASNCIITLNQNVCVCPDITYGTWDYNMGTNKYCMDYSIPSSSLCQATSGTFCFEPIFSGGWILNESGQYCQDVSCPAEEYCEGFDITQLCFTPEYNGDWFESDGQYCRVATCSGYVFCPGLAINECYDYEIGNCDFSSNYECHCQIIVDGDPIKDILIDPVIEWDFVDGQCIQTFYCDGSDVAEFNLPPEGDYGWEFNEDGPSCFRVVICSEEDDVEFDQENDDPYIEWTTDGDGSEIACIAYIECDDDSEALEEEGEVYLEWDFDQGDTWDCIAEVYCGFDGDLEYTDDTSEEPAIVGNQLYEEAGIYYCLNVYTCGDGAYTEVEEIPNTIAVCSPTSDPDICVFSCGSNSEEGLCNLVNCDDIIELPSDRENNLHQNNDNEDLMVSIQPNPFRDQFRINNLPINQGDLTLDIVNGNGLIVKTNRSNQKESLIINTTKLAEGIYFIKIYNEDRSFVEIKKIAKIN